VAGGRPMLLLLKHNQHWSYFFGKKKKMYD